MDLHTATHARRPKRTLAALAQVIDRHDPWPAVLRRHSHAPEERGVSHRSARPIRKPNFDGGGVGQFAAHRLRGLVGRSGRLFFRTLPISLIRLGTGILAIGGRIRCGSSDAMLPVNETGIGKRIADLLGCMKKQVRCVAVVVDAVCLPVDRIDQAVQESPGIGVEG
jgi:hypothetical protein